MPSTPTQLTGAPPPAIDCALVLCYAIVDDSVGFAGRTLLFVGGKELGPVERLAICRSDDDPEFLLLHCDKQWETKGCAAYSSIAEAKARAESIYPGIESRWVEANVSVEAAEAYLDALFGDQRCSVCGKRADKLLQLYKTSSGYVYGGCKSS